ncbi:hypothetical protein UlMin_004927 [Ulmus minor]
MGKVRKDYVLAPSKGQIYRAKRKVEQIVEGSLVAQYAKIRDYGEELKKCNPGSTIVIEAEVGPKKKELFKRIYICLDACKKGWIAGCRPIIGLDACHTKSFHKAQLMFAVGLDAENSYYIIAYEVVEREGFETWKWFLELLKVDLELEDPFVITFMFDRQKGLIEAVGVLWDGCEHMFCVRHLYANFKKKFKGDVIRNKLWQATRTSKDEDFKVVMNEIKAIDERAWLWLCEKPPSQWTRSHFRTYPKCDMLLKNLCESVNGDRVILEARFNLILSMLEMIRVKIMNRRAQRRIDMNMWYSDIGPRIAEIMEVEVQKSGNFIAIWGGNGCYQVNINRTPIAQVDLDKKTCTCK